MIPDTEVRLEELEEIPYANKTYRVNLQEGRIDGTVDGMESVKQAVIKILNTDRFAYAIYDDQYGNELETFIGKDYLFVKNDLKRVIEEALLVDDRIVSIEDFNIDEKSTSRDSMVVSFLVRTDTEEVVEINEVEVKVK